MVSRGGFRKNLIHDRTLCIQNQQFEVWQYFGTDFTDINCRLKLSK